MIYGHDKEKTLINDWLLKESKGVLILNGPEGVGKFSLAKEILNKFIDYEKIIIKTEDKLFRIETARFLERISFQKNRSKRVFIVDDFHKLRNESQNVILKTIEEPPSSTVFIFTTHRLHKILPTIRSRAIVLKFNFLERELTFKILREKNFSDFDIDFVMKIYPQQPGKAIRLLNNRSLLDYLKKFFQMTTFEKINSLRSRSVDNVNEYFYYSLLEIMILSFRNELFEKIKRGSRLSFRDFNRIRELLDLYNETDYDLRWDLQLVNFILNHG